MAAYGSELEKKWLILFDDPELSANNIVPGFFTCTCPVKLIQAFYCFIV